MVLLNFMHIGLHQFIENHMEFLRVMEFPYLIMKVHEEEKHLLQGR